MFFLPYCLYVKMKLNGQIHKIMIKGEIKASHFVDIHKHEGSLWVMYGGKYKSFILKALHCWNLWKATWVI